MPESSNLVRSELRAPADAFEIERINVRNTLASLIGAGSFIVRSGLLCDSVTVVWIVPRRSARSARLQRSQARAS